MAAKEAKARIKINKLLEESGWHFFDQDTGKATHLKANIVLEPKVKLTKGATYYDNATIPHESPANWLPLVYPSLDFFACLEEGKKIFLRRYELRPGVHRFTRTVELPLIKSIFGMVRSVWRRGSVSAYQTDTA